MSARRALITGVTGQDGSYLADFLLEQGYQVHGLVRRAAGERFERIDHCRDRLHLHEGDLLDARSVADALRAARPQEIYNLAAQSHVAASWRQPELTAGVDAVAVVRLLDAVREVCPEARFYQASSAQMFGRALEVPQSERTPLRPRSPYAGAKAYAHQMTAAYRDAYDLHAVSGIAFNHSSPRQSRDYVLPKITWQAAAIRLGVGGKLRLGDLEAERDWGFALDYVRAMWMMLQRDDPEDFVLATGSAHSVRECLEVAFGHAGLSIDEQVELDADLRRPAEPEHLVGDASKARHILGWQPDIGFEDLIRMMVDASSALLRYEVSRHGGPAR